MPNCNCDGAMDISNLEDGIVVIHAEDDMHALEVGEDETGNLYVQPLMRANDTDAPMLPTGKPINFTTLIKQCPCHNEE